MLEDALDRRVKEFQHEKRNLLEKNEQLREQFNSKSEVAFTLETKMQLGFDNFQDIIERLENERSDLRAENNRLQVERNEVERMMHMKVEGSLRTSHSTHNPPPSTIFSHS